MDEWYCRTSRDTSGPFSIAELQFLRDRQKLHRTDEVRLGECGEWRLAGDVDRLFAPATSAATDDLDRLVPIPKNDAPTALAQATDSQPLTPKSSAAAPITPPPRILPASEEDDDRWRRAMVGAGVGAAVVILILLLLLLFLPSMFGGGAGEMAGGGSGNATGDDSGHNDGDDETDASSGEIVEEDVSAEAASMSQAEPTRPQANGPAGRAERPSRPRPTLPSVTIAELSAAPNSLGELNERLSREGAGTGDVQVSLIWYNVNDLDLHILCPSGERIYYGHKESACGGELDVDMNAGGRSSSKPVENAFWPTGGAPSGRFQIFVHHYQSNGARDPSKFEVVVKNGPQTKRFSGSLSRGDNMKKIYEFTR